MLCESPYKSLMELPPPPTGVTSIQDHGDKAWWPEQEEQSHSCKTQSADHSLGHGGLALYREVSYLISVTQGLNLQNPERIWKPKLKAK